MPADNGVPDAMHLRSLRLENVRAFGHAQNLDFITDSGAISRWNLILGGEWRWKDNTDLQALEVMLASFRLSLPPGQRPSFRNTRTRR